MIAREAAIYVRCLVSPYCSMDTRQALAVRVPVHCQVSGPDSARTLLRPQERREAHKSARATTYLAVFTSNKGGPRRQAWYALAMLGGIARDELPPDGDAREFIIRIRDEAGSTLLTASLLLRVEH
jgi:hypothetical protein